MKMTLPYRAALSDTDRWHASSRAAASQHTEHGRDDDLAARRSGGPGVTARRRRLRLSHSWRGHDELANRTTDKLTDPC